MRRTIGLLALPMIVQSVLLAITAFRPGHHAPNFHPGGTPLLQFLAAGALYGSVMPAPGVSLFDACVYAAAGWSVGRRSRSIRRAMIAAAAVATAGFVTLFAAAAVITPSLVRAAAHPFVVIILGTYWLVSVTYAVLLGMVAGAAANWTSPLLARPAPPPVT